MGKACPICNNPTIDDSRFCKQHHLAHERLQSAFDKWRLAHGNEMTWRAFLERVIQLPETGRKAQEVGKLFLETDLP